MENHIEIEGKKYGTRYPVTVNNYLKENAKKIDEPQIIGKSLEFKEAFAPLIPIAVALVGGAIATWLVNKEQKEHLIRKYLELIN